MKKSKRDVGKGPVSVMRAVDVGVLVLGFAAGRVARRPVPRASATGARMLRRPRNFALVVRVDPTSIALLTFPIPTSINIHSIRYSLCIKFNLKKKKNYENQEE